MNNGGDFYYCLFQTTATRISGYTTGGKMKKVKWLDLTTEQQTEFKKQMLFAGYKKTDFSNHAYQIKNGQCHGFIVGGANRIK